MPGDCPCLSVGASYLLHGRRKKLNRPPGPDRQSKVNKRVEMDGAYRERIQEGARMQLEIRSVEAPDDPHVSLMAPDSFHLNSSRATSHKIYRDNKYHSRLILPVMPR